jgi:MFS family permease
VTVEHRYGDAAILGWLIAVLGAGSLVGGLLYGVVTYRFSRRWIWIIGYMFGALPYFALGIGAPLWVVFVALAAMGLTGGGLDPLLVTVRHERIPAELRGRVFGTFSAISMAAAPLGVLLVGVLAEGIGLDPTLLALAVASQALAVALVFAPALHEMDRRPKQEAPAMPELVQSR